MNIKIGKYKNQIVLLYKCYLILGKSKFFAIFYDGNFLFSKENSPGRRSVTDFRHIRVLFERITNNVQLDSHYLKQVL